MGIHGEWEKLEKIPAWQLTKASDESQKQRPRWPLNQGIRTKRYIFASLVDLCHLKNSELELRYQKWKGRVVLRGDTVKDDSGSYAVVH